MNEFLRGSIFFGIVISLLGYVIGAALQRKVRAINPLLVSIVLVAAFLLVFGIDYDTYNASAQYISRLLTPATVCLAVPLYRQISVLKKHFTEIMLGILSGAITSMGSILLMSYAFGLTHEEYVTLLPKSITTAIGMGVSEELGGIVNITVAVIVITGVLGDIFAVWILRLFRVKSPVAAGLGIGTAAHAIGTAKAFEFGETEGAMSSLSIAVSGLITVIGASFFAMLY